MANLVNIARKEVPAEVAFIPLLAIIPNPNATSSTLYLNCPAIGATYLKDSPIRETLVFEFLEACASTSTNLLVSFAFNPNAVRESVTISDVLAKSSPLAAARFIIPSIPSNISLVFQPAIDI